MTLKFILDELTKHFKITTLKSRKNKILEALTVPVNDSIMTVFIGTSIEGVLQSLFDYIEVLDCKIYNKKRD